MASGRIPVDGRAAFVSGAASGIGRAMALRLAAHGCPVALVDIDADGLARTAERCSGPVLARELDVRDAEAQRRFAEEVARWAPSPLGMVFNNAGVAALQSIGGGAPGDDDWVMTTNYGGVVAGTRAFLPVLRRQDCGVIVNVSSVFGLIGMPGVSAYCAAKFAVRGFTDALRHELRGTGVSAATVLPGGVRTGIVRHARVRPDPARPQWSPADAAHEFDAIALTSPERAARIIHRAVRAGRPRILVGPDAHALELLARLAPVRYYEVLARLESLRGG